MITCGFADVKVLFTEFKTTNPMLLLKELNRIPFLIEPCKVWGYFSIAVDDICGNGNLFFPRQYTVLDLLLLKVCDSPGK